jgi:hypothetical protein
MKKKITDEELRAAIKKAMTKTEEQKRLEKEAWEKYWRNGGPFLKC